MEEMEKEKYTYCHIDTWAGVEKLKRLQNSKVWEQCGNGFQIIIFRYVGKQRKLINQ